MITGIKVRNLVKAYEGYEVEVYRCGDKNNWFLYNYGQIPLKRSYDMDVARFKFYKRILIISVYN